MERISKLKFTDSSKDTKYLSNSLVFDSENQIFVKILSINGEFLIGNEIKVEPIFKDESHNYYGFTFKYIKELNDSIKIMSKYCYSAILCNNCISILHRLLCKYFLFKINKFFFCQISFIFYLFFIFNHISGGEQLKSVVFELFLSMILKAMLSNFVSSNHFISISKFHFHTIINTIYNITV